MRFLHRVIHRDIYRVTLCALVVAGRRLVGLPEVTCPNGGVQYVADAESR